MLALNAIPAISLNAQLAPQVFNSKTESANLVLLIVSSVTEIHAESVLKDTLPTKIMSASRNASYLV